MARTLLITSVALVLLCVSITSGEAGSSPTEDAVTITYTLWVYSNVSEVHHLELQTRKHNTFYHVMEEAAQEDPEYRFETVEYSWGHYVTQLAGHSEVPKDYMFWMIFKTPELPDPANPPNNDLLTPVGVDEILVEDGDHYLFWLKKV